MQSDQSPSHTAGIEQVIQDARKVMAQAQRLREQSGLPTEDARTVLESQLSEKDLAQVRAAVQADLDQISRDALHQSSGAQNSPSAGLARKHRQII